MPELSISERLLYGGLFLMLLTIVLVLVCFMIFRVTGGKIRRQLEQEYGRLER